MTHWPFRVTNQLLDVLEVFLHANGELYGLEIAKRTHRFGSTIVGVLERLHAQGWVTRRWEAPPVGDESRDRPTRRYYRLSEKGAEQARLLLHERRWS